MSITTPSFLKKYLTDGEIANLRKKKALHIDQLKDLTLVRLTKDYRDYPRGTVFFQDGFIPGYPRIMRVLHLKNGIARYITDRFYVEEKVDGYNVRVAVIDGIPLAFTRGGFICPFTTSKISDLLDLNFFGKYPEYVINGEIVGPGSPYNTERVPYLSEDVVFFAFDLFDNRGRKITTEERYALLESFSIQQVRRWGSFSASDTNAVRDLVLGLDRNGREGIVIKPVSKGRAIKYVTLSSCLRDIQASADLITELPAGYYIQRILRAVFFCHEFGISLEDQYLLESAKALYCSSEEVVKTVAEGGEVRESFQIRAKSKNSIHELLEHLHRIGISTRLISIETVNDYYEARFQRIYTEATREIRHRLTGHGLFD